MTGIIKVDDIKDAGGNSIISSNGSGTLTYTFNAGSIAGAAIANDAIDSAHYADGSIDTAHIADNQVTLAKMAGLARGKIIVGDSSGDPAALAVGSANYVLTSDGTDAAWAAASSFNADAAQVFNESGASVDFRVEGDSDTHLLMVDGSGDKVGIGEDVPEGKLHIFTGDASVGPNANADELVVEGSANSGMSILSGNSSAGRIYFGDSGDDDIGQIRYNHDDNSLNFKTNTNDVLKLSSAGVATFTGGGSNSTEETVVIQNTTDANPSYSNLVFKTASGGNVAGCWIKGVQASGGNDGRLEFHVNNSGTVTESMRLTYNGLGRAQFLAKAWCSANGTGTVAIIDSHNISSLSDHETGQLGMNFATNMANNNYTPVTNAWQGYAYTLGAMDVYSHTFKSVSSNGSSYTDVNRHNAIVFGD